jgi:protein-disulfide isomerase
VPERRRPVVLLGAAAALAAVVVLVLVLVSSGGDDGSGGTATQSSGSETGKAAAGRAEAAALVAGIPQNGPALCAPDAPVTVYEFADLQCPFCRDVALQTLPDVIRKHVRPGQVRIVYQDLAFLGPDSVKAARAAAAAGEQDRLWQFVHLMYANQGEENSGWVTDALLQRIWSAIPGLDVERTKRAAAQGAGTGDLARARRLARQYGIDGTPSFVAGRTGGSLQPVDPADLNSEIDALVGG